MNLLILALLAGLAVEPHPDSAKRGSSPTPADDSNRAADDAQRGSRGSTAGGDERTGPPAAGIEAGDANGLAGGRTDEGPRGGTGIREGGGTASRDRARSRAAAQRRGRNKKGSFDRPAGSPPDMNRHPKPIGSGVSPEAAGQEPGPKGRNYREGPAGKGAGTQPDKKQSGTEPDAPR